MTFDVEELSGSLSVDSNKRWKILESKATLNRADTTNVRFTFEIQRFSDAIYMHVKIPGYALITITLLVLCIKPGSFSRSLVIGASIYLHFSLMDRVWWQIPKNGSSVPRILKYMAFMLILTTFVLVETIMFKLLTQSKKPPPLCVLKIIAYFKSSSLARSLGFTNFHDENVSMLKDINVDSEEATDTETSAAPKEIEEETDWIILCSFIDKILFICLVISYAVYDG